MFYIFGDAVGDPIADRLLRAIKTDPQTDTELYELLGRHDGGKKDQALDLLVRLDRWPGGPPPPAIPSVVQRSPPCAFRSPLKSACTAKLQRTLDRVPGAGKGSLCKEKCDRQGRQRRQRAWPPDLAFPEPL